MSISSRESPPRNPSVLLVGRRSSVSSVNQVRGVAEEQAIALYELGAAAGSALAEVMLCEQKRAAARVETGVHVRAMHVGSLRSRATSAVQLLLCR